MTPALTRKPGSRVLLLALAVVIGSIGPSPAQVNIIDDDFDGPSATGWRSQGNTRTFSAHNITQADSLIHSEVVATQSNTNRGIASDSSFEPSATGGFSMTFTVASVSTQPGANGFFIGLVRDNDVFHRDTSTRNFGLAFFGQDPRTGSAGGFGLVYGDNNGSGAADHQFATSDAQGDVQPASFLDGFTATVTADPDKWTYEISGLLDRTGTATTFNGTASWTAAGTTFDTLWPAGERWFATAATQVVNQTTHRISLDRITIDRPVPPQDTDSDGMTDAYELANGTDINTDDSAADADSDGLTNLQEFLGQNSSAESTGYGRTRSGTADSDSDGLGDGDEVHGTRNSWQAGILGTPPGEPTNPNDPDSDNDGGNDGTEIANRTDPNAAPPNTGPVFTFTDTDADSFSDAAETAFGSDPHDRGSHPDHTPSPAKPNIVIIYTDDLGFGDIAAYGNLYGTPSPSPTPNVNALAAQGVLFTQAHSSNGVCTPSRYALLTGKYNWREFNGITNHFGGQKNGGEVPRPADVTIAEFLKQHAYDTAAFGKWHLGGAFYTRTGTRVTGNPNTPNAIDWARPVEHHAVANGFDIFRGLAATINRGPYVYLQDDRVQDLDRSLDGGSGGYRDATNADTFRWISASDLSSTVVGAKASTPSLGDPSYTQIGAGPQMIAQVENYIADRAASEDPDPFFAYVSFYSPHLPQAITPPFAGSIGFDYADFNNEVDDRVGRVVAALDNNGFRDNTMVVFTSDNGPENVGMSATIANGRDANGPLRGNKRDVWDGGTRVPFVVRWPGQAAPGLVSNELVWQGDIFATIAAYLHVDLPDAVAPDAESFLNTLRGQQKPTPRRPSIIVSSIRGDLALKTVDGWKFIDSSGGGHNTSWDSKNRSIPSAAGNDRGVPKQLFHQALDLGEDNNIIAGVTSITDIRSLTTSTTGTDLLAEIDRYRTTTTTGRFPRLADNDADRLPNRYEISHGLDPDSPKDADQDLDGDGNSNLEERLAGTDPSDPAEFFRIVDLEKQADEITLTWPSVSGVSYQFRWSTDLTTWHPYSVHAGTGTLLEATLDRATIDPVQGTHLYLQVSVQPAE